MEDTLRGEHGQCMQIHERVLILVVMEDTIRANETEGLVQYNVVS